MSREVAGYSLLEAMVATTILGVMLVSLAPLESYLLRRSAGPAGLETTSEALGRLAPQFQADVRRAVRAEVSGTEGSTLLLGSPGNSDVRIRYAKTSVGVVRSQERRDAAGRTVVSSRIYRGSFTARFAVGPPEGGGEDLVRLEVDSPGRRPLRLLSLHVGMDR